MIIGLTGTISAGKSMVADYLKKQGFEYYSYSGILIEEAKKRGIGLTRKNLQKLGIDIKNEEKNLGILSKRILAEAKTDKVVADGIRNPDEIRELRKANDAFIIGIDAPQKLRFERLRKRAREGDPKSFDEFKELDDFENKGIEKGQEINKCLKIVDFLVVNDSSLEELYKKIDGILSKIAK